MLILALMLTAGFLLLLVGGEVLVRGSVAAASRLGVSKLIIGITLVGFGTSMPELVTSVQAVYANAPGIAVGNFVGSNIANILLVLGLTALLVTVPTQDVSVTREGLIVLAVTILFIAICLTVPFDRTVGLISLVLFALCIVYTVRQDRRAVMAAVKESGEHGNEATGSDRRLWPIVSSVVIALVGMAMVIGGAHILVDAAIQLSRVLGVPEHVIGLTIVAVGTSLPELITFLIAAIRSHSEIGLGNLLGSNLFNLLGIGGVTATLAPDVVAIPGHIAYVDNFVMLAATVALLVMAKLGSRITRVEGAILFGAYLAYSHLLFATGAAPLA